MDDVTVDKHLFMIGCGILSACGMVGISYAAWLGITVSDVKSSSVSADTRLEYVEKNMYTRMEADGDFRAVNSNLKSLDDRLENHQHPSN